MTGEARFVDVCGMSRSGTTLLTTMLDAHPSVSMGYELLPADLPRLAHFRAAIARGIESTDGTPRKVGNALKASGLASGGVFVKRAARALVEPSGLIEILDEMASAGWDRLDGMAARRHLSRAVVRAKMAREETSIGGHKIGVDLARSILREESTTRVVFIVRDPRDVVASQRERGFDTTLDAVMRAWNALVDRSESLLRSHPERSLRVAYEALVRGPEDVLRGVCAGLDLSWSASMLSPASSKASVLRSSVRHANADNLARETFTSSIGRGAQELSRAELSRVESKAGRRLSSLGYVDGTG